MKACSKEKLPTRIDAFCLLQTTSSHYHVIEKRIRRVVVKRIRFCLALMLVVSVLMCACVTRAERPQVSQVQGSGAFEYAHDPRLNPEAMKDIVENPAAVYGFSPNPDSTRLGSYAQYDWTDPAFAAKAKEDRIAYHDSFKSMTDILNQMKKEGATEEQIARAVSTERNRLRLAAYDGNPEGLAEAKKSNLDTYGHEDGPTPDQMFEKYGSWETVIQKAFSPNLGMDACCGLYDHYYPEYVELGLAE